MRYINQHAYKTENLSLYTSYGDILLQNCNIRIDDNSISVSDLFVNIFSINYYGEYHKSSNSIYMLTWNEKRGLFLLLKRNYIILKGIMKRPYHAYVSPGGKVAITNYKSCENNRFYIISPNGTIILSTKYPSNIGGISISDNDIWAVCQTCASKIDNYSNKIILYNLDEEKIASTFTREVEASKKCLIYPHKKEIHLLYENSHRPYTLFRYTFDGELLNREIWDKYCDSQLSGYDLSIRASRLLKNISSNCFDDYSEPFHLLCISLKRYISPGTKAYILKHLGDIYRNCGVTDKAIILYEESLKYNSKMPIKRILKVLKQSLNQ